jgi:hypothetical protein
MGSPLRPIYFVRFLVHEFDEEGGVFVDLITEKGEEQIIKEAHDATEGRRWKGPNYFKKSDNLRVDVLRDTILGPDDLAQWLYEHGERLDVRQLILDTAQKGGVV